MESAATVLARESFMPFGARRGFIGQEMLDSASLSHMNGAESSQTVASR